MKVEQGQPEGFTPITITLETKKEADIMWAALNCPATDIMKHTDGGLTGKGIGNLVYQMWDAFDDVHPTGW